MSLKSLKLVAVLGAAVLMTSACSLVTVDQPGGSGSAIKVGTAGAGAKTSVFFSINGGKSWQPEDSIPTTNGQAASLNGMDVRVLRPDPEDSSAVYLASMSNGLYYTYDIKKGWTQVGSLPALKINDVQVDAKDKCVIYAAAGASLYKSDDCARTWSQAYVDGNSSANVNTVAIDFNNPNNVYIGTSAGQVLKSINGGQAWRSIHSFPGPVARVALSPLSSGRLFVATSGNEVFTFTTNSNTDPNNPGNIDKNFSINDWHDATSALRSYSISGQFRNLVISPVNGHVYLATSQMIFESSDNGNSWAKLKLLQSSNNGSIRDIAVDPKNPANIYYVTTKAFFTSTDSGVTWKVQALPSGRNGQSILIDFHNPQNIYLGTTLANN